MADDYFFLKTKYSTSDILTVSIQPEYTHLSFSTWEVRAVKSQIDSLGKFKSSVQHNEKLLDTDKAFRSPSPSPIPPFNCLSHPSYKYLTLLILFPHYVNSSSP